MTENEFCRQLEKLVKTGESRRRLGSYELTTARAANKLCDALRQLMSGAGDIPFGYGAPIGELLYPFQNITSQEAADVIHARGVSLLIELAQRTMPEATGKTGFLMKLLVLTGTEEGIREVIRTIREGKADDGYLWSVTCSLLTNDGYPQPLRDLFCDELRRPLPSNFVGVAYLDFCNTLARQEQAFKHPFDTPEGHERLHAYLVSNKEEEVSYAHSATAALPFISRPARDGLFSLAMDHPSSEIQVEAAWASARLGSEGGIQMLQRFARDPNRSAVACSYLVELDREDAIPAEAADPDFRALAEMSQWLQHPSEFGRTPDSIEVFDSRTLFWPPTNDERRLWLIKYRYRKSMQVEDESGGPAGDVDGSRKVTASEDAESAEGQGDDIGLGMVGSVTFALFGETTANLTPLEAYALHCCWELSQNGDRRAPKKRTIAAGVELLKKANKSLRD